MPGLYDAGHAYYSIALSAMYLPVHSCLDIGPYIFGCADEADLLSLRAMVPHEVAHETMATSVHRSAMRLSLAKAYRAIWRVFGGGEYGAWTELQAYNRLLARQIGEAEMVEELFATLMGIQNLRRAVGRAATGQLSEVHDTEDRQVEAQCAATAFGPVFKRRYGQLALIYDRAGDHLVRLIYDLAIAGAETETRLDDLLGLGVRLVRSRPRSERQRMTKTDWFLAVQAELPSAGLWLAELREMRDYVERDVQDVVGWWDAERLMGVNPVATMFDLAANRPEIIAGPLDPSLATAEVPDDPILTRMLRQYGERKLCARAGGMVVVVNANPDCRLGAVLLCQQQLPGPAAGAVPVFRIASGYAPTLPRNSPKEFWSAWKKQRKDAYTAIAMLVFLEGLRQTAALGHGLLCPLHFAFSSSGDRDTCCGLGTEVAMLWRSGMHASERYGEPIPAPPWGVQAMCMDRMNGLPRTNLKSRALLAWGGWMNRYDRDWDPDGTWPDPLYKEPE